ncbi:MAG: 7-cyano-7-deazaguanine synthase [Nitrospirota bacterium]
MTKAIALYSGGLDSTLAILVAMRQGIEVTAVTFLTHFGCDISDRSSCSKDPFSAAQKFGFEVKLCHLSDKFIEIVKHPRFGHGKNMNPCIDCRILMLKEAKALMAMRGADVLITGEVLGQRPMSQRRDTFPRIDREAGVQGLVLRPLSAKLLKPTLAEEQGLVDRELLYAFNGRSRKPQMALAAELGLTEYPAPAGGCLLTDPIYSYRLRELLRRNPSPALNDIHLLRVGRHFRVNDATTVVVGRKQEENEAIQGLAGGDDVLLWVEGCGSPLTLVRGESGPEAVRMAACLCARYSDAKARESVPVTVSTKGERVSIEVPPASEQFIEEHMIKPAPHKGGVCR